LKAGLKLLNSELISNLGTRCLLQRAFDRSSYVFPIKKTFEKRGMTASVFKKAL
jgi:hypothetical protein